MPLPVKPDLQWPPATPERADLTEWSAWYSGDPAQLAGITDPFTGVAAAAQAGFATQTSQRFWPKQSRRTTDSSDPAGVHVPLAGEIAQVSSDLLFGDFPSLVIPFDDSDDVDNDDKARTGLTRQEATAAQARLEDLLIDSNFASKMREAAEACAALGGVYIRNSWDTSVRDHPFPTIVHADQAIPDWRYDQLYAVTFWRELPGGPDNQVWRHLERHEPGVILHGLYAGTPNTVGVRTDLSKHTSTAGLPEEVSLPTGYPYPLTVEYVPNVKPHRKFRGLPVGRADISGTELLCESLDICYSSWMRDIENGKGRIIAPTEALEPSETGPNGVGVGRGSGMRFNLDRNVYDGLNLDPTGEGQGITIAQFAIREQAHQVTALAIVERIVSAAGYAPQTFGIGIDGSANSGTALRIREKRTYTTLNRKQGYWEGPVRRLATGLLALDALVFGRPTPVAVPTLAWHDPQSDDPVELAQTLVMLATAKAASVETRVRKAQQHLDEDQVKAEVQAIYDDETRGTIIAGPVPDPTAYLDAA